MNWLERPARDAHGAQQLLATFLSQMDQWQNTLPEEFRYRPADYNSCDRIRWARASLYLRANQLRILMLRPFLYTYARSAGNAENFELAAKVACDNFRVLADLEATSSLLHTQRALCSHFLLTVVSALLLIAVHRTAPSNAARIPASELLVQDTIVQNLLESLSQALDLLNSLTVASDPSRELSSMVSKIDGLVGRLRLRLFGEIECRVSSRGDSFQTGMDPLFSLPGIAQPVFPLIDHNQPPNGAFEACNLEMSAEARQMGFSPAHGRRVLQSVTTYPGERDGFTTGVDMADPTSQEGNPDNNPNISSVMVPWESDPYFLEPQDLEELSMMFFPGHMS